ncbi:toxin YoeB [Bacteroidia bacterium]|nr:toxin YoeB [Bacteroidia bacterium]
MYSVEFSKQADMDIARLKKSIPKISEKIQSLIKELEEHPYIGTGHPEPLKGNYSGCYSRRITHKHRLIYEVNEDKVLVYILSAYGHYD